MGTPADVFTPLAAFKDGVQMVFHSGDRRQTVPFVNCTKRNEMYPEMRTSHFGLQMDDTSSKWTKACLDTQFRMHPHISEWPATQFYSPDNKRLLFDAPGVAEQDAPLQLTLQEIFQRLGPAWNEQFRIGIDVSGTSTSKRWGTMTSLHNKNEAKLALMLARYLVHYEPITPGARKIVPNDIYMASPYKAQQRYLRHLFMKTDDALDLALADRVKTTKAMQGKEASIVLVTHTINVSGEPATLKFTANKRIMNVNATRAKNMLIWIGNWADWCKAVRSDERPMCRNSTNEVMLSFVEDFLDAHTDIISSVNIERVFARGEAAPESSTFMESIKEVCNVRKSNSEWRKREKKKREAEEEKKRRQEEKKKKKQENQENQERKRAEKDKKRVEEAKKKIEAELAKRREEEKQFKEDKEAEKAAWNQRPAERRTGKKSRAKNKTWPVRDPSIPHGSSASNWRRVEHTEDH